MIIYEYHHEDYGGFWRRTLANFLDGIFFGLIYEPINKLPIPHVWLIWLLIVSTYLIATKAAIEATPGMWVLGLKFVSIDGGKVTLPRLLIRFLASFWSALAFGLGYLWVAFDRHKQAWHDKIAGTYVIKTTAQPIAYRETTRSGPVRIGWVVAGATIPLIFTAVIVGTIFWFLAIQRDLFAYMLSDVGFHAGFPDTPKKKANLKNMVQRKFVVHTWNGKVYYVYAVAEIDRVYVGNQAAYQRLQEMVAAKKIAKDQVMAVEMNEATAMDWDAWGSFPYHFRAHDFIEMGEYDQAIAYFTKSLEIDPGNAWDYAWRGFVYMKKGENDRALTDYNKALEINPKHACALHNRGELYIKQGKFDEAIADCNQVIKSDPDHHNAYVVRGLAYFGQGQFEKALADYQKALELDPRPDIAYYYKGEALAKTGRPEEALTAYQKFLKTALPMHANQVREAKERIQNLKSPGF